MADLLPSIPETSAPEEVEPRVVGLDEDEADDVFGALSSETARELFAACNRDPAHPSALADVVDTSLQNAQYHLEKLEDAGLVEVVDTAYSAKGREMDIYAPADRPLVLFAGDEEEGSMLRSALRRLLGGWGILAGLSIAVQGLFGGEATERAESGGYVFFDDGGSADAGSGTAVDDGAAVADGGAVDAQSTELGTADDVARDAGDAAGQGDAAVDTVGSVADDLSWIGDALAVTGIEPGVAVFAIGSALLALAVGVWYLRQSSPA